MATIAEDRGHVQEEDYVGIHRAGGAVGGGSTLLATAAFLPAERLAFGPTGRLMHVNSGRPAASGVRRLRRRIIDLRRAPAPGFRNNATNGKKKTRRDRGRARGLRRERRAVPWLRTPLPWMIGPLAGMAIFQFSGARLQAPPLGREAGQLTIGIALGLYFTPAVAREVLAHAPGAPRRRHGRLPDRRAWRASSSSAGARGPRHRLLLERHRRRGGDGEPRRPARRARRPRRARAFAAAARRRDLGAGGHHAARPDGHRRLPPGARALRPGCSSRCSPRSRSPPPSPGGARSCPIRS